MQFDKDIIMAQRRGQIILLAKIDAWKAEAMAAREMYKAIRENSTEIFVDPNAAIKIHQYELAVKSTEETLIK